MKLCILCLNEADENNPETYHEVTSWVNGPKLDGPKLRSRTGHIAHAECVERLSVGQAVDQPTLDVPDLKERADELQSAGPDEFPRGYYEHVAETEAIESGANTCEADTATGICGHVLDPKTGGCLYARAHVR